jgi:hypothetical protein
MDLIETLGLNVTDERPIHYIIGVAMHPATSSKRGQIFLKYGPVVFTNTDVVNLKLAIETSKLELQKTTMKEALSLYNVSHLVHDLSGMLLSCQVNQCSVHHFSTHEAFDDDYFDHLIDLANESEGVKEFLFKSQVKGV